MPPDDRGKPVFDVEGLNARLQAISRRTDARAGDWRSSSQTSGFFARAARPGAHHGAEFEDRAD